MQTYNPESFPIECAKEQDYLKFYSEEIKLRKILKYPPFCDIIKIEVSSLNEENTRKTVNSIYEKLLKQTSKEMQIFAPMPSPISKIKNRYRWRIIIKAFIGNNVIKKLNEATENIKSNQDTRVSIDINPNNMN